MFFNKLPLAATICLLLSNGWVACRAHDAEGDHAHDTEGNHVAEASSALEGSSYTLYTDQTELFVEFKPLVVGDESRFAAHFTALGELFTAIDTGTVTLTLARGGQAMATATAAPDVPGIFRLALTPELAGTYDLLFYVNTPTIRDTITIQQVEVYANEEAALAAQPAPASARNELVYLKEQAWRVEFANAEAKVEPFAEVVKTTGQIMTAPGDEAVLAAQIDGTVSFTGGAKVAGTPISSGVAMFSIAGTQVVKSNLGAAVTQAQTDLASAKTNYDRAAELVKDQIISQKDFLEAKRQRDNAQTRLADVSVAQNFNANKQSVRSPMSGYLSNVMVENGQFVTVGQALATVTKTNKLLLEVRVPQRYFAQIGQFTSANIRSPGGERVYSTAELNGSVVSSGKTTSNGSPFVPLFFEIDHVDALISGATVQVFLQANHSPALVIPASALLEEQGMYYVYVQVSGEAFEKRELELGSSDGAKVQVVSGLTAGERVVTRGGYQIKLSTASGVLPAHGHEH